MSSTAGRAASVLRDGVYYSGSAIVNGVNAITPHVAGAVDILVVRQPDGTLKSTPFYVRFGKYSSLRARDRTVRIFVNGAITNLEMHLGSYGQAYFIAETKEIYSASEDEVEVDYSGILSSPSGYSSNEEDGAPFANEEMLETMRREVCKLHKDERAKATQEGEQNSLGQSSSWRIPDPQSSTLLPSPFNWRSQKSVFKRRPLYAMAFSKELGKEEKVDENQRQESLRLSRKTTFKSVKSCPSFQTIECDFESLQGSDANPNEEFFSTVASPKNSAQQNNESILSTDLEIRPSALKDEENVFEADSRHVDELDVNDGYDGDTELIKTQDANYPTLPSQRTQLDVLFRDFELSLCGAFMETDMSTSGVQKIFDLHKVSKEALQRNGADIVKDPSLMCRIEGKIYRWNLVSPAVLGMLAFGGSWEDFLQPKTAFLPEVSISKENPPSEKSSGWSLWPFMGRASKPSTESELHYKENVERKSRTKKKVRIVHKKVLSPTPEQLASLNLENGQNVISYRIEDNIQQEAYMYVIDWSSRLVISDIDGTVTRSDILGHILTPIGVDWTHSGVTHLFSNIKANGYEIMFLSSRAIAQASITRDFLHRLEQEGIRMPLGPVIISPHGLLPSLYREMILRRPHDFKIGCLQDVRQLFPDGWNPFYAGFGNRDTDVISYEESGVPPSRIFTINPRGVIIRGAASCVQTSTWSSLKGINELVNEVFPFYEQGITPEIQREEFNEFQYWRVGAATFYGDDPELMDLMSHTNRTNSSLNTNVSL